LSIVALTQAISPLSLFVPNRALSVDAPIAKSSPRMISPTQVRTFKVESQNSISPYLRTLNMLKAIGKTAYTEIHTAGLT